MLFTHEAAELGSFKETYVHILRGYGIRQQTLDHYSEINRELALVEAQARAAILNTGKLAIERLA